MVDAPKNAVPVGTVAGVQLPAVLKSELTGAVDQVASWACAGIAASKAAAAAVVSKCLREPRRDWHASRSRIIALCPPRSEDRSHAARDKRKLGQAPTFGRNFQRVARTPQPAASLPRTTRPRREFAPRGAELPRPKLYFLALSALNISKPCAGLRFLCTTACTALIIACGASDWKMLRPMSTPAAPCWTAL